MIKMLIDHGALADIKGGSHGDTPLHYAIRLNRPDLVLELLAAGNFFNNFDHEFGKIEFLIFFLGVDMSIMNNAGESIIETAKKGMKDEASPQMEEIIKMLEDVCFCFYFHKSP
jgi:ankyrin repeat protein